MSKILNYPSPVRSLLVVVSLLGLTLTSIFLSRRSSQEIQEESTSIYQDRLVPTAILVKLTTTLYQKRLLLETSLVAAKKPDTTVIESGLTKFDRRTDSLLTEFKRTKLTDKETDYLQQFSRELDVYKQLESKLITNISGLPQPEQVQRISSASKAFSQIIQTLDDLSSLQLTIGQELVEKSRGETNYIYVLTALQIGLVLFVGVSLYWHRF